MKRWNEEKITQAYRDFVNRELKRPEIRLEKKEFIRDYFEEATPWWHINFDSFVHAGAFAAVIAFLFIVVRGPVWIPTTVPVSPDTIVQGPAQVHLIAPGVEVKRLTSMVGPTMVYQKMYQNTPMTIIWVFVTQPNQGIA